MDRPLVLVSQKLPKGWLALIEDECEIIVGSKDVEGFSQPLLNNLHRTNALFTLLTDKIDEKILMSAPNLRVISNMTAGVVDNSYIVNQDS